ncbi:ubiquinone biosynthesis protein UbiB [Yersinia pseudotuberculosis]|uniref:Probable protein kinase UbiB n=1 Tax=Yersinia pseudotuberculosis serotype O:3 (strain YPIII) TaxID=502800 RepID=A0A0H3B6Q3_YERPY|nr:ubiquinone biosynthesis regulatory protein kinase UbiB [Yersinia pseudotuberculosis]AJJ61000.1 2-polyprenylphenol 6-hydroxylase [Yersinia pseudotuberculosis YPIII]AYW85867.1 ubiquinone biosynthesis protein UbiB [Yersinia pseudotuberculosis]AYX00506.1 ubiquinone biosynthesis protein UbiB [Yersinia pseudotuberculosis]AZA32071.1 ubiquinone biosynthesis protein UbiB [Yersinia pseudotuberculosis]MBK1423062.1 ubiquinone biosynthesis regulatory protein kinase UbiB [Yersinia pseudotuberculosis]
MTPGELRRLYLIIRVFLSYGLDELIPNIRLTLPLRVGRHLFFWLSNRHKDKSLGERLRLALQELGPVWIKFGQMMSTRRDLFPPNIADQLALLQDRVASFDGALARKHIEIAMGGALETWFDDFDSQALASASIAQVHTARLKENGKEVVLKVIRPDILPIIKADVRLMYRLAGWVPKLLPDGRRLRPREVVREYEKTLLDELNLLREAANAIQLRRNFEDSPMLYIPEVYSDYCRESVLVMERIYGIPVSDIAALEDQGTNMKLLAERGVQVFFTQVFRDSFFHADMHPGNIFVSYEHPHDPLYIGIDCGIVGSLNKADKRYLAENFIAFFNRDYRRVAELHVDSGWVPRDTNVEDFEFAIRTVCEPIFEKPLAEISFGHVLLNLFNTARRFNMEVQPQLVLLQKTLLYVEGLGRQLYPQLDLWTTAKPFLESWLRDQVGLPAVIRALKEKAPFWAEKFPELPELVYDSLQQHKLLQQSVEKLTIQIQGQQQRQGQSRYLFGVGATLLVSGTILFLSDATEVSTGFIVAGALAWFIGWRRTC